MEHRKPYNLKNAILVYNAIQMIYNAYMFVHILEGFFINTPYNLYCMETLPADHPIKNKERWISYVYFLNKVLDMLDTVFFVLRKSYKQITVLHVYHHITMVCAPFLVMQLYGVGGQFAVMGLCNTFVHAVMYYYYFISAMYPGDRNHVWWKKYITRLQIVQFVILCTQSILMLLFNRGCGFPVLLQYLQLFESGAIMVMFGKFYYKAYIKPQNVKQQ
ncbi:GH19803 [Drosophila grimshawi]|uniref:Elongation of very long chain fatty acids protein n=1 Tax=Drosophila grimshawi TaxID=7222 RepID=B4JA10_DROGR|nr:GH19803 [Drosophila grimshawi]